MHYDWDFQGLAPYTPAFLRGVGISLALAMLSSALGTLGGIPLALLLRTKWLGTIFSVVVDIIRAIPNLVLILFFYYLPYNSLLGWRPLSGFSSALLALALAQAAYSADLIRAAIAQVPRNQIMGVEGLGFSPIDVVRDVVVPSVVKQVLPGHVALWIGNVKLSSLASVIGVEDVVYVARVAMAQNFRSLESWIVVAAIYVAVVLPLTYGLRRLERSNWVRRQ